MRSHLEQLTLAVAKLPLYHKFLQEIKLHQDQHDALLVQRSQCAQKLLQLKQAVAAAERTLSDTEADLALIGFDEERHRRLETVREDAFRLRSERDRLISALRQAEQDEARVEHAQNLTNQIAKEEEAAKKVRQQTFSGGPTTLSTDCMRPRRYTKPFICERHCSRDSLVRFACIRSVNSRRTNQSRNWKNASGNSIRPALS